jgi:hypothetical protein
MMEARRKMGERMNADVRANLTGGKMNKIE